MAAARRRGRGSPADPPRVDVTSSFKKEKGKKSRMRAVGKSPRPCVTSEFGAPPPSPLFSRCFSRPRVAITGKLAEGSELGPSVYLFPEVRKRWCIFRSQLSAAEARHGASKTLSENTTVILLQTARQHNKVIFFERRKEMGETPQKQMIYLQNEQLQFRMD